MTKLLAGAERKRVVKALHKWLGDDGISLFQEMRQKHGTVSAVFPVYYGDSSFCSPPKSYPHCLHLREGMQVRNFLRTLPETSGWDAHDYDGQWAPLVEAALSL